MDPKEKENGGRLDILGHFRTRHCCPFLAITIVVVSFPVLWAPWSVCSSLINQSIVGLKIASRMGHHVVFWLEWSRLTMDLQCDDQWLIHCWQCQRRFRRCSGASEALLISDSCGSTPGDEDGKCTATNTLDSSQWQRTHTHTHTPWMYYWQALVGCSASLFSGTTMTHYCLWKKKWCYKELRAWARLLACSSFQSISK